MRGGAWRARRGSPGDFRNLSWGDADAETEGVVRWRFSLRLRRVPFPVALAKVLPWGRKGQRKMWGGSLEGGEKLLRAERPGKDCWPRADGPAGVGKLQDLLAGLVSALALGCVFHAATSPARLTLPGGGRRQGGLDARHDYRGLPLATLGSSWGRSPRRPLALTRESWQRVGRSPTCRRRESESSLLPSRTPSAQGPGGGSISVESATLGFPGLHGWWWLFWEAGVCLKTCSRTRELREIPLSWWGRRTPLFPPTFTFIRRGGGGDGWSFTGEANPDRLRLAVSFMGGQLQGSFGRLEEPGNKDLGLPMTFRVFFLRDNVPSPQIPPAWWLPEGKGERQLLHQPGGR